MTLSDPNWRLVHADVAPEQKLEIARKHLARGIDPFSGTRTLPGDLRGQLEEAHQKATLLQRDPGDAWMQFLNEAQPLVQAWNKQPFRRPMPEGDVPPPAETILGKVPATPRHLHASTLAGRIRTPLGNGTPEAQSLYQLWRGWVDTNNLSSQAIASAWKAADPTAGSEDNVRTMYTNLNLRGRVGRLFETIAACPTVFFDALEADRAARQQPLTIDPATRLALVDAIANAREAAKTASASRRS